MNKKGGVFVYGDTKSKKAERHKDTLYFGF